MLSRLGLFLCVTFAVLASGCLSFQSYGSPMRGHLVTEGAKRPDVLANLGEPDSIYKSEDSEVFIYKGYKGSNCLHIYAEIKRTDTVVVMDAKGTVLTVETVDVGKGTTIIAPPFLDVTHPVSSQELTEKPENYDYTFEVTED